VTGAVAYGLWPTPITAARVAALNVTRDALQYHAGAVYWVESNPAGGYDRLLQTTGSAVSSDVVPDELGVGSSVYGYGGGAYAVADNVVWFSAQADQRLYRAAPGAIATPLTPSSDVDRYGDLHLTPDRQWLMCVRERCAGGLHSELVAIPATGGKPIGLASTGDLHAGCEPSPDGRQLAWTSWRHRDLPWDCTSLWVADLRGAHLGRPQLIAGGDNESIVQPRWSPDGVLHFVSDRSGWWNLYRWRGGQVEPVAITDAEMAPAPWELGYCSYTFLDDGTIAVLLQRGGRTELAIGQPGSAALRPQDLPYTSIKPYLSSDGRRLALIGSTPNRTPAVAIFDPTTGDLHELADGRQVAEERFISHPQPFNYRTRDGDTAHGLNYRPTNPDVQQPDLPPPLIVRPHAGPSTNVPVRHDPTVQFFTSRGFAVADIDYRGSTGYGRTYRRRLDGHWGELDVADCADASRHLIANGHADAGRVFISGASAGGYTALMAAVTTRDFAAVTARSAIIDPAGWQRTTALLQRHQADSLLAPSSFGTSHSVTDLASRIAAPVLLIHGDRDEIAPTDHVRRLARRLDDCGVPCTLLVLGDEAHIPKTSHFVQQALDTELAHYLSVLGQRAP
jgi:dipeptidyl aminopeptidase/acylaminoacyl peptidase